MSPRPLQAFFLGHGVIRQIEPFGRWQTVQTKDEGALLADQIIGHGPSTRMINQPVKWKAPASHLHFVEQRGLQSRPLLLHQDFEPGRRLNLSQESLGGRTQRHDAQTIPSRFQNLENLAQGTAGFHGLRLTVLLIVTTHQGWRRAKPAARRACSIRRA